MRRIEVFRRYFLDFYERLDAKEQEGNKVVLLHGFLKKTRKTPISEIEKAKNYKREYDEQKNGTQ